MQSDSIEGIYDTLKQCALISKNAGGIGVHVHNIRSFGSYIAGVSFFVHFIYLNTFYVPWFDTGGWFAPFRS